MRKKVVARFLIVVTLAFLVSPLWAGDSRQPSRTLSSADRAFLASLIVPAKAPAGKAPAAKRPRGQEKALCFAGASCGSYSITCTGNNSYTSCSAVDQNCAAGQQGRVTCDGVTTWCAPCPPNCWDREQSCARSCYPCDYDFWCSEETGDYSCDCSYWNCPV